MKKSVSLFLCFVLLVAAAAIYCIPDEASTLRILLCLVSDVIMAGLSICYFVRLCSGWRGRDWRVNLFNLGTILLADAGWIWLHWGYYVKAMTVLNQ